MIKSLMCLLLASAAGICQGQAVWRCGADGRSYSDQPCADGRVLALADPRRAGGAAEAPVNIAMLREQRLAQQFAEQRREREREARVARELSGGLQRPAQALKPPAAEPPAGRQLKPKRPSASAKNTSRATVHATRHERD